MRRMLENVCIELINLAISVTIVAASLLIVAVLLWGLRQIYIVEPRHRAIHQAEMAAIEAEIAYYDTLNRKHNHNQNTTGEQR